MAKGIELEPIFLIRFFRNLLLGENNTLKNHYMMINPPEEWKMPEDGQVTPQVTLQVTLQITPQVTPQVVQRTADKFSTNNMFIKKLVQIIGSKELSIKEILEKAELKDRKSLMDVYIYPAVKGKYVRMLYPQSPRHPRQKYLLTVKGLALYNELNKNK